MNATSSAGRADTEAPASPGAERPFRDAGKLTPRQARFIEEYLIDLNATQAAIRAGYSAKNADKIGPELLGKTRVAEAIEKAIAERSRRTEITQDSVLRELALIGFADMADFTQWSPDGVTLKDSEDLTPEHTRIVAEVSQTKTEHGGTIKFKLHDKQAALVNLGRHLGLFHDNLKVNGLEGLKELSNEELNERISSLLARGAERANRAQRGPNGAKPPGA
jgi:phage terminase small subunit